MPGSLLLVEGPAGSGKSQLVASMLDAGEVDVLADLTALWVALRGVERLPSGRYPIRHDDDPTVRTGLAAQVRATVVRQALRADLRTAVTSGSPRTATRWARVAEEERAAFQVRTVDPGEDVARRHLAEDDGTLSDQCERAVDRWYR